MTNHKIISLIVLLLMVSAALSLPASACGLGAHKSGTSESSSEE